MLWETTGFLSHQAAASIVAGFAVALPDLRVTVDPCESRPAGAAVASLARVHTGGAISTRLVVGAVVQIC